MSESYFAQVAGQWDALRAGMFDAVRDIVLARAALHPMAVVADIGAGTGFLTQGLARRVLKVYAVDRSPAMLQVARQNLVAFPNVVCLVALGQSIPLPDGCLDAVVANMYLHHAPDPGMAVVEMARLLRPAGRLVVSDLDEHDFTWLHEEQGDLWPGFNRGQVAAWFEAGGLARVQVECSDQSCSCDSQQGMGRAAVSIFVAVGVKPGREGKPG